MHAGAVPEWVGEGVDPARTLHSAKDDDANLVEVAWTSRGSGIRLTYSEGATFYVAPSLGELWMEWTPPLTEADAAHFLLEPVLAFVLRRRGTLVLHASGVAFGARGIAICGDAGAGKSTTAGACLMAGASLVSDDVLALGPAPDGWQLQPGTRACRVWDDGARALVGDPHRAPVFSPTWDKRVVAPAALGASLADTPVPLALVCVLSARSGAEPEVTRLRGYEAVRAVVPNTSAHWAQDVEQRAVELRSVARLVTDVMVVRVVAPDEPAALPHVAAAIRRAAGG
ncbi:MAG TPA: hypothetical protein VG916_03735 [Gemmatimonadaceae bacterium]|nr:hypothetical protein [Gemmatimonadaceae bacterium]